jgi:hypothetical protein
MSLGSTRHMFGEGRKKINEYTPSVFGCAADILPELGGHVGKGEVLGRNTPTSTPFIHWI